MGARSGGGGGGRSGGGASSKWSGVDRVGSRVAAYSGKATSAWEQKYEIESLGYNVHKTIGSTQVLVTKQLKSGKMPKKGYKFDTMGEAYKYFGNKAGK